MKDKRELLEDLLSGRITPDQFRRQAAGPYLIRMVAFDSPGPVPDPGQVVRVSLDLDHQDMTYGSYLDLVKANPGAAVGAPIIFTETPRIDL